MTKELTLNDQHTVWTKELGTSSINPKDFPVAFKQAALNAMDEWAKSFAKWLTENTSTVTDYPNITLYRYCDRHNECGNYTLDDIYQVFEEENNK